MQFLRFCNYFFQNPRKVQEGAGGSGGGTNSGHVRNRGRLQEGGFWILKWEGAKELHLKTKDLFGGTALRFSGGRATVTRWGARAEAVASGPP
ncbi:hypothetical protein SLE2022_358760 [Rubroshorea leprosula]